MMRTGLAFIGFAVALYCVWILCPTIKFHNELAFNASILREEMGYFQGVFLLPIALCLLVGVICSALGIRSPDSK